MKWYLSVPELEDYDDQEVDDLPIFSTAGNN